MKQISKGILGIKVGQTFVFDKDGKFIPVTVIKTPENFVTKKLTFEKDGYNALQLSAVEKKIKKTTQAQLGLYKKLKINPQKYQREIRNFNGYNVGDVIKVNDIFNAGDYVDITGISKGKGFQGVIKRHNFSIGPKSHGSGYHRGIGSMGWLDKNAIAKNHKMPGRMGVNKVTLQNLEIVLIDKKNQYCLVKGAIPGAKENLVLIQNAIKKQKSKEKIELFDLKKDTETIESIAEKAKEMHDVLKKEEEVEAVEVEKKTETKKESSDNKKESSDNKNKNSELEKTENSIKTSTVKVSNDSNKDK